MSQTKRNSYSRVQAFRDKYLGHDRRYSVRMLSPSECEAFRAHIEHCRSAKPKPLQLPAPIGLPD